MDGGVAPAAGVVAGGGVGVGLALRAPPQDSDVGEAAAGEADRADEAGDADGADDAVGRADEPTNGDGADVPGGADAAGDPDNTDVGGVAVGPVLVTPDVGIWLTAGDGEAVEPQAATTTAVVATKAAMRRNGLAGRWRRTMVEGVIVVGARSAGTRADSGGSRHGAVRARGSSGSSGGQ
jgi:hypothetical protein